MSATHVNRITSFTVTPSLSGNTIIFTISDANNLLTTSKMVRAVLMDAHELYKANQATVADGGAKADDYNNPDNWEFVFETKLVTVNIGSSTSGYSTTALVAVSPFADV